MRRLFALSLAWTLIVPAIVHPTTVKPPTFGALVAGAQVIFVGEVTNLAAAWDATPHGRAIVTRVTFRVSEVLKGSVGPMTQLEFLGGVIGEIGMKVEGMPAFRVGQRDVLFVGGIVRAASPLVGFMHGRLRVERDPGGIDRVFTHDGQMLRGVAEIGPQRAALAGGPGVAMRLADLAAAVRAEGARR